MASWRRQFLLRIWPIQLAFLRRILFRSVLFSPIRLRTCSLVTFYNHFIFPILLHHHISKFSKYFRTSFLSVQVSLPPNILFLKSSRSCVILLPTPFTSVICPLMASWRRQSFSEYNQSNWLLNVGYYLCRLLSYTVKNLSIATLYRLITN